MKRYTVHGARCTVKPSVKGVAVDLFAVKTRMDMEEFLLNEARCIDGRL